MSFFKALCGICYSPKLDNSLWQYQDGTLLLKREDYEKQNSMGVYMTGGGLPNPVLLFRGNDGVLYAIKNVCSHMRRKIDPVPGSNTLRCCSVMHSSFDYSGRKLSGPANKDLVAYDLSQKGHDILIKVN